MTILVIKRHTYQIVDLGYLSAISNHTDNSKGNNVIRELRRVKLAWKRSPQYFYQCVYRIYPNKSRAHMPVPE